jgi:hypothetical protein
LRRLGEEDGHKLCKKNKKFLFFLQAVSRACEVTGFGERLRLHLGLKLPRRSSVACLAAAWPGQQVGGS